MTISQEDIGYLQPIDMGDERNGVKGAAEGIAAGARSGAIMGGIIAAAAIGPHLKSGPILVSVEVANEEGGASAVLRDSAALEVDSLGTATPHTRLQRPAASQWFAHPYLIRGKQLLASR